MRLIDADELKDHISELLLVYSGKEILDAIDKAPTLPNPCGKPCAFERPHGEWVLDKEFSFVFNIYECSKCRFNGSKRWHFCPNCGAKMLTNDRQVTGKLNEEPKDSLAEYWNSIGEWKEGEAK